MSFEIVDFFQLFDVLESKLVVEYFAGQGVKLFQMILSKWKTLKELVYVLKIPYNATVALQNPNITLSDVFGIWTKMRLHLEACAEKNIYKTKMSNYLVSSLNARKDTISNNSQMDCCLFLDPRFRGYILNDSRATERAKTNLVNIWRRLNFLGQTNKSLNETSHASSDFRDEETNESSGFKHYKLFI